MQLHYNFEESIHGLILHENSVILINPHTKHRYQFMVLNCIQLHYNAVTGINPNTKELIHGLILLEKSEEPIQIKTLTDPALGNV